ncbi:BTAD domain-containing putative transcriptional regulator [Amycolatopsis mongoliensis]|uniref:BTAD domain-containing putative transcriptional regulator n=1 Tax=Amycolatopsis mongoliensis TaxID=715475 RepID=A0A9Y2JIU4_9PSEU|nr:BTAD domain-containing putative transcriptional regulator [Amycolatopsis sp. 4-36]WIX98176.1 BTAD domain-containing putative transcriptional regulator [Amycolatopsis sp. 4-36]
MTEQRLRVEVLGSLRAWLGDDELALGPARQRAVFAALATGAVTRPISRAELIRGVWGEAAPASAKGSVHTYISGLRRILEPDRARWSTGGLLLSDAAGYRLRLDGEALDLQVFTRLRETAQSLWQNGDAAGTVETLDRALDLWRGEALSGVPGPYAGSLRANLAEQRVLALELRADALLDRGSHEDLVPELTVLVREHPLREPLWRLLMTALHRSGRTTEALDTFRSAREVLRNELGVAPGPELTRVHQQILTNDPAVAPPAPEHADPLLHVLPGQVAHAIAGHRDRPSACRGREHEIGRLRQLADAVLKGSGRTVWIEGEPGIGKSELLTSALADVVGGGCHVAWGAAGELGQSFPLQVITECLGLGTDEPSAVAADVDPVAATADRVLAYVDRLCGSAPLVVVVDDLQWADEASVLIWNRLSAAARQLPLLLIATSRPAHRRQDLARVRRAAELRGLELITLGPLLPADAEALIEDVVGGRPDEELRSLVDKTAGNPLYLREVTAALVREDSVEIVDGIAKVREGAELAVPESLFGAVARTLAQLDELTREAVRRAAVLGMEFGLTQVAATMGVMPSALLGAFDEVMAMGIVVDAGTHLAFRHPLLRWTLYNEIAGTVRAAWHRRAAEALADTGAGVEHVAQQLVAVPAVVDDWVIDWLADHHVSLSTRAPSIAAVLLRRVLDVCGTGDPRREVLLAANVLVVFGLGQEPLESAKEAMVLSRDPARAAEMRHIAAAITHRRGDTEGAIALLAGNDSPETPPLWRERRRSLLANFSRGSLDDLGRAARRARRTYRAAVAAGEPYPIAHALQTLWLIKSIERDHGAALRHIDHAVEAVEGRADQAGLYFDLLDNKMFTLQNLDRMEEAQETLRTAWRAASAYSRPHGLQVSSAVHDYWTGSWDDALVELDSVTEDGPAITFHGLREPGPAALLLHGLAGLIHGRRGEAEQAAAHLLAAEERLAVTDAERENCDFLLVARSLRAEQQGKPEQAIDVLAPIMDPAYARMMLRHQWLPRLGRLAREHGRADIAAQALDVCREEAGKEIVPARATAAAQWCEALVSGDPEPLLQAIAHYGKVGRVVEMASALADVALLLAEAGRREDAQTAVDDAVAHLNGLGAAWDVRHLGIRMRKFGIASGEAEARHSTSGWSSLSPMEREIAALVGQGRSNPEIAAALAIPRRTVQAHVTRVLAKLGLSSRSGLAEPASPRSR